ncbi:MAG: glycosyl hydrolase, partial [Aquirufa sp.]
MRKFAYLLLFFLTFLKAVGSPGPTAFSTSKPWAYWWWPGSAVTEKGITHNLENFAKAGFGGLHIIPIYGAKGYESSFLSFLGPDWNRHFAFVLKEAKRLHLGIDMTLGTGGPLGGPQVNSTDAAKKYQLEVIDLAP